eukprot:2044858-Rhodomonas_salina.3
MGTGNETSSQNLTISTPGTSSLTTAQLTQYLKLVPGLDNVAQQVSVFQYGIIVGGCRRHAERTAASRRSPTPSLPPEPQPSCVPSAVRAERVLAVFSEQQISS